MMTEPANSQTRRTPTDGDALCVDQRIQFYGGESTPTANGATADAGAGPSAAKSKTIAATMITDKMDVVAGNNDAPKAIDTVNLSRLSSSGNVTAPPAKSSAARTDPSPPASSEEEWHSASSRLQRTPHSDHSASASSSSSFYATPGTVGMDGTIATEAVDQTKNGGSNNSAGDLSSSTSSSDKIADARKKLQWTPPPSTSTDNKVRIRILGEV